MYIHKEGKLYVIIATILFFALSYPLYYLTLEIPWLGVLLWTTLFLLYVWVWWFFRIPKREYIPQDLNVIYAPADGKVVVIEETVEDEYFKEKMLQISIFMSPLNVHVNRNPISGLVTYYKYHKGKYLVAWHPKSSTENERTSIAIEDGSRKLMMRQIAGAVARRICCYVNQGNEVTQLDEFGFIKFGSRVDVYLPLSVNTKVKLNQKTKGGQTILAEFE